MNASFLALGESVRFGAINTENFMIGTYKTSQIQFRQTNILVVKRLALYFHTVRLYLFSDLFIYCMVDLRAAFLCCVLNNFHHSRDLRYLNIREPHHCHGSLIGAVYTEFSDIANLVISRIMSRISFSSNTNI